MWPFSKKHKSLAGLPSLLDPNTCWTVSEGMVDGSPLLVRINQTAQEWRKHPELSVKVGFAMPLNRPVANGLPDPEENQLLTDAEDTVLREVEKRTRAVHALTIKTGVMQELVVYVLADADIAEMHTACQAAVSTHEVQCIAVREPNWETYAQFC